MICEGKVADYSLAVGSQGLEFCRVSVDEVPLPILSAKLLGSVKLIAAGLLSLVAFRTQMDVVQSDVVLARWQCRLLKSPPLSPRSEIHFHGLCKSVVWFFNTFY